MLRNLLKPPLQGLILQCYGTGNAPQNRPEFFEVLKEAIQRDVLIVAVTQCVTGMVDLIYETGQSIGQVMT